MTLVTESTPSSIKRAGDDCEAADTGAALVILDMYIICNS